MTKTALGNWHHGQSNGIECLECEGVEEGWLGDGLSDGEAMKRVREHIAKTRHTVEQTRHTVEQSRTIYRYVKAV